MNHSQLFVFVDVFLKAKDHLKPFRLPWNRRNLEHSRHVRLKLFYAACFISICNPKVYSWNIYVCVYVCMYVCMYVYVVI